MFFKGGEAALTFEFMWSVLTFCFVMSAIPGPNNAIAFSAGLNYGFLGTVPYMLGASGSISLMFAAVAWGIGEFFAAFPEFYGYMRYAGTAYILYLSWKIAAAPVRGKNGMEERSVPERYPTFLNGVLLQWTNPIIWLIAVAGVANCMGNDLSLPRLLFLCVAFFVMCLLCLMAWSFGGNLSGRLIHSPRVRRAINLFMGLLLASSALRLF